MLTLLETLLLVDEASSQHLPQHLPQHRQVWSPQLYDAVLRGLLDAIVRLDLTYAASLEHGEEGEGLRLVPCTPSDMHAFLNLVQLATSLLPACKTLRFRCDAAQHCVFLCECCVFLSEGCVFLCECCVVERLMCSSLRTPLCTLQPCTSSYVQGYLYTVTGHGHPAGSEQSFQLPCSFPYSPASTDW